MFVCLLRCVALLLFGALPASNLASGHLKKKKKTITTQMPPVCVCLSLSLIVHSFDSTRLDSTRLDLPTPLGLGWTRMNDDSRNNNTTTSNNDNNNCNVAMSSHAQRPPVLPALLRPLSSVRDVPFDIKVYMYLAFFFPYISPCSRSA